MQIPDAFLAELNEDGLSQFLCIKKISEELKPKTIFEIGSGWGVSASAMLTGSPEASLLTLDPISPLTEFDRRTIWLELTPRITRMQGRSGPPPSAKYTDGYQLLKIKEKFDLIFIDGSHHYEDVLYDLNYCFDNFTHGNTTILVDDFWHRHNFSGNYGVNKAVCETSKKYKIPFIVYPAGHGVAQFNPI